MFDNEHYISWGNGHQLHAGVSYLDTRATSDNYDGQRSLRRFSLLAGNRCSFFGDRLLIGINGRAEYFSATTLPVTGNFAVEYHPVRILKVGANLSTFYRQPTLNELYWIPGGNRDLHPESGEGADAIVTVSREKENFRFSLSGSLFSRSVRNWILWVPGTGGNPSPLNLQQVWSRGGETSWNMDFFSGQWRLGLKVNTSYVRSTVVESEIANSGSVGRQLIYTPLYTANSNLSAGFRNSSIFCLVQYAGYRFTTTDNSSWLHPYVVISLRATQSLNFLRCRLVLFAAVNNLLDQEYAVLAGRPMPLRSIECGITIHINHQLKNEKK
jgi:iron complex outermembrane receptor protein